MLRRRPVVVRPDRRPPRARPVGLCNLHRVGEGIGAGTPQVLRGEAAARQRTEGRHVGPVHEPVAPARCGARRRPARVIERGIAEGVPVLPDRLDPAHPYGPVLTGMKVGLSALGRGRPVQARAGLGGRRRGGGGVGIRLAAQREQHPGEQKPSGPKRSRQRRRVLSHKAAGNL
ncbi:hypothetical protein GGQ10_003217 [Salinibacter ruber]|nr:hypothetical protein [Salinibacter ruber]